MQDFMEWWRSSTEQILILKKTLESIIIVLILW